MPQLTINLSNFQTPGDFPDGGVFYANSSGGTDRLAHVMGVTLTLTNIATYVSSVYLDLGVPGYVGTFNTSLFSNNGSFHTETVSLTSFDDRFLAIAGLQFTFHVHRSGGSGNGITIRTNTTGYLTVTYEWVPLPIIVKSGGVLRYSTPFVRSGGIIRREARVFVKNGGIIRQAQGGHG
jgi:hypothetical protein